MKRSTYRAGTLGAVLENPGDLGCLSMLVEKADRIIPRNGFENMNSSSTSFWKRSTLVFPEFWFLEPNPRHFQLQLQTLHTQPHPRIKF